MEEKIKEMLYNEEEGLMVRIRNGCEELTESEEKDLIVFSKEVNRKIKEKKVAMGEILTCMDVIFNFMWHPGLREVATIIYNEVMNGIDF